MTLSHKLDSSNLEIPAVLTSSHKLDSSDLEIPVVVGSGELPGEQRWCGVRQGRMGAEVVVVLYPGFDLLAGVFQGHEPVHVQAFIAQATVERFDERIVRRLTGPGEVHRHPVIVGPLVQADRDELRPVVGLNPAWQFTALSDLGEEHGHIVSRQ